MHRELRVFTGNAHPALAQTGTLGELRLAEAGTEPVFAQFLPKGRWVSGVHFRVTSGPQSDAFP